MVKFHETISKKINDKYFGIKVDVALKKGHLPDHEVEKFTKNATNAYHRALAYIEKWYPFENQNYKTFSCLNLECRRLPTLDQLLELWSISPWKQQTPPEQIYDELSELQSVFPSLKLEDNSIEMGCKFFQKEEAPNLLKIVQFVCSVPVSNAFVERIFSVMGNVWTDERNRLAVNTVKSELCIFFSISSSCTEFKDAISTNKPLLKAVSSNAKHTKK
ncbi:dimer_Tnp_hAT domain-containing protein [Trichonephila clavipes]|nr:dimer_Tnp_hAT domain-containing protein [Trichonephila clavipes]